MATGDQEQIRVRYEYLKRQERAWRTVIAPKMADIVAKVAQLQWIYSRESQVAPGDYRPRLMEPRGRITIPGRPPTPSVPTLGQEAYENPGLPDITFDVPTPESRHNEFRDERLRQYDPMGHILNPYTFAHADAARRVEKNAKDGSEIHLAVGEQLARIVAAHTADDSEYRAALEATGGVQ